MSIAPEDRWRLILGTERDRLPPSSVRAAAALDELYGEGHGEGSNSSLGGGSEAPAPSAREWAEELDELFGAEVREQVLGRAAARGRADVLQQLEPDSVTPSVARTK